MNTATLLYDTPTSIHSNLHEADPPQEPPLSLTLTEKKGKSTYSLRPHTSCRVTPVPEAVVLAASPSCVQGSITGLLPAVDVTISVKQLLRVPLTSKKLAKDRHIVNNGDVILMWPYLIYYYHRSPINTCLTSHMLRLLVSANASQSSFMSIAHMVPIYHAVSSHNMSSVPLVFNGLRLVLSCRSEALRSPPLNTGSHHILDKV